MAQQSGPNGVMALRQTTDLALAELLAALAKQDGEEGAEMS